MSKNSSGNQNKYKKKKTAKKSSPKILKSFQRRKREKATI